MIARYHLSGHLSLQLDGDRAATHLVARVAAAPDGAAPVSPPALQLVSPPAPPGVRASYRKICGGWEGALRDPAGKVVAACGHRHHRKQVNAPLPFWITDPAAPTWSAWSCAIQLQARHAAPRAGAGA